MSLGSSLGINDGSEVGYADGNRVGERVGYPVVGGVVGGVDGDAVGAGDGFAVNTAAVMAEGTFAEAVVVRLKSCASDVSTVAPEHPPHSSEQLPVPHCKSTERQERESSSHVREISVAPSAEILVSQHASLKHWMMHVFAG